MSSNLINVIPVLPSQDISRDLEWYEKYTGFKQRFGDDMYAGMIRDHIELHLQWHADNESDPLLGGSVVRIQVKDIRSIFNEYVSRGTVPQSKLRLNTDWHTHEFGFYDLNNNAIFIVQDIDLQ